MNGGHSTTATSAEGKVVLLGESGVGKSSIAKRFVEAKFVEAHDVTIGGAYFQKNVVLRNKDINQTQERTCTMHLWDTGGHEKFRSMMNLYYRDAIGAIICYDIGNAQSFEAVNYWINEMMQNTSFGSGGFMMALVGNKSDLPQPKHKIQSNEAIAIAKKHKMLWAEVSALTGDNIEDLFERVAERIFEIKTKQTGQ